jgi:hypothetical protein
VTRDEQVEAALALLAPAAAKREQCRRNVDLMLDFIDRGCKTVPALKMFGSKEGKAKVRRYANALCELQAAYDALGLIKPWFSLTEIACVAGNETAVIERELAKTEAILAKPSARPKPEAIRGKFSVAAAHHLLLRWGHKASVTRGGRWERLAKALAGDDLSVFEHVRAFKNRRRSREWTALLYDETLVREPGIASSRFAN